MKESRNNNKNTMSYERSIFIIAIPIVLVIGIMIGVHFVNNHQAEGNSVTSWILACATVAISILTIILAVETSNLRKAQTAQINELKRENIRPNVNIKLENYEFDMNFVSLIISNHGKGVAKKVNFQLLDKKDNIIEDDNNNSIIINKFLKIGVFKVGMQTLGINQELKSYIFSFLDLAKNNPDKNIFEEYINININFEDIEGTKYTNNFSIEFAQYEGMGNLGKPPLYEISNTLKNINLKLNSSTRIKVETYDSDDRKKEVDEIINRGNKL